jgi:hypothetical protein
MSHTCVIIYGVHLRHNRLSMSYANRCQSPFQQLARWSHSPGNGVTIQLLAAHPAFLVIWLSCRSVLTTVFQRPQVSPRLT